MNTQIDFIQQRAVYPWILLVVMSLGAMTQNFLWGAVTATILFAIGFTAKQSFSGLFSVNRQRAEETKSMPQSFVTAARSVLRWSQLAGLLLCLMSIFLWTFYAGVVIKPDENWFRMVGGIAFCSLVLGRILEIHVSRS